MAGAAAEARARLPRRRRPCPRSLVHRAQGVRVAPPAAPPAEGAPAPTTRGFIAFELMVAITNALNLAHKGVYKDLQEHLVRGLVGRELLDHDEVPSTTTSTPRARTPNRWSCWTASPTHGTGTISMPCCR